MEKVTRASDVKTSGIRILLTVGHTCADMGQGALPALLPFLIAHLHISYAAAAGLVFASTSVSCLCQPFFGLLGDKIAKPWFMSIGIFLSGGGLAAAGFMDAYWKIFLAIAVSGVGVALFHPEGGKMANLFAGEKKASGMSVFSSGGFLGFCIGPILLSSSITLFGMRGTAVFLVPTSVVALLLLTQTNEMGVRIAEEKSVREQSALGGSVIRDDWRSFRKVVSVLFIRSVTTYGFSTFLPIFWVETLRRSASEGSVMLTAQAGVGIVALLVGGVLADRYGFKRIILIGSAAAVPLYMAFSVSRVLGVEIFLVFLIPLFMNAPQSTLIAMAQSYTPNHIGFASGITLGLGTTIGGITSPLFGAIGDRFGITLVLYAIVAIAFAAAVVVLFLPADTGHKIDEA
jgi:FSR family fosmidomycin resistance protein-like MFS transporter